MFYKYVDWEDCSGYLQVFCAVENFLAFLRVPPVMSVWVAQMVYPTFLSVTACVNVTVSVDVRTHVIPTLMTIWKAFAGVSVCLKVSLSSSPLQRSSTC